MKAPGAKFRKGHAVEVLFVGEVWLPCVVTFVWSGVDLETKGRAFWYDVAGLPDGPRWSVSRVPESMMRRADRRRGCRRVLRAHSVKAGRLT